MGATGNNKFRTLTKKERSFFVREARKIFKCALKRERINGKKT